MNWKRLFESVDGTWSWKTLKAELTGNYPVRILDVAKLTFDEVGNIQFKPESEWPDARPKSRFRPTVEVKPGVSIQNVDLREK